MTARERIVAWLTEPPKAIAASFISGAIVAGAIGFGPEAQFFAGTLGVALVVLLA